MPPLISIPPRRSAAASSNYGTTFVADRPVGQSHMDERVDQQASFCSLAQRTTAQPRGCDHLGGWLLSRYVKAGAPLPLRFSLRGWLRLSLPLSLRGPVEPKGRFCAPQRGLRAWRFA